MYFVIEIRLCDMENVELNYMQIFLMYHNPKLFYNNHVANFMLFYDNVVIMLHF